MNEGEVVSFPAMQMFKRSWPSVLTHSKWQDRKGKLQMGEEQEGNWEE